MPLRHDKSEISLSPYSSIECKSTERGQAMLSSLISFVGKLQRTMKNREFRIELNCGLTTSTERIRIFRRVVANRDSDLNSKPTASLVAIGFPSSNALADTAIWKQTPGNRQTIPSPRDQRSNSKNPNNPAYRAAANNRSDLLSPNNRAHQAPRRGR